MALGGGELHVVLLGMEKAFYAVRFYFCIVGVTQHHSYARVA